MAMNRPNVDQRRARLVDIVESLPEAEVRSATGRGGDPYLGFRVRNKSFGYYLNDHHGDGIIAVCLKSSPEARSQLVASSPERFYVPPYLGPKGWVGPAHGSADDRLERGWRSGRHRLSAAGPQEARPALAVEHMLFHQEAPKT